MFWRRASSTAAFAHAPLSADEDGACLPTGERIGDVAGSAVAGVGRHPLAPVARDHRTDAWALVVRASGAGLVRPSSTLKVGEQHIRG